MISSPEKQPSDEAAKEISFADVLEEASDNIPESALEKGSESERGYSDAEKQDRRTALVKEGLLRGEDVIEIDNIKTRVDSVGKLEKSVVNFDQALADRALGASIEKATLGLDPRSDAELSKVENTLKNKVDRLQANAPGDIKTENLQAAYDSLYEVRSLSNTGSASELMTLAITKLDKLSDVDKAKTLKKALNKVKGVIDTLSKKEYTDVKAEERMQDDLENLMSIQKGVENSMQLGQEDLDRIAI
ncbi:hypothetical protein ACFL1U_03520 [Patescibacteria group bacterium]